MNAALARRTLPALFAVLSITASACGGGDASARSGNASTSGDRRPGTGDSAGGSVDLGGVTYTPGALAATGSVQGTITLAGGPRIDVVHVAIDSAFCGTTAEGAVIATANGLSNAVVWIAGITSGKALPVMRRIDLASEDCALDPRVQATVVGATVNVTNADKLLHKLVFTPIGTHDTLTVMPFFNNGQVVPSERLTKRSGIVEVRCAFHPWTRAYIAVFDHPYFAVTNANGAFTIDSLPPGSYRMMVWHEGAARPVEQQITVAANATARADVALTIPAAP